LCKFSGKVGNGPVNKWLNFGGDLHHCLDTGTVFQICQYWEIWKVVNGHKSAAHTASTDGDTGKTCLGGGVHYPSASSWHWYHLAPAWLMPRNYCSIQNNIMNINIQGCTKNREATGHCGLRKVPPLACYFIRCQLIFEILSLGNSAVNLLLKIPPHRICVSTLPCETTGIHLHHSHQWLDFLHHFINVTSISWYIVILYYIS